MFKVSEKCRIMQRFIVGLLLCCSSAIAIANDQQESCNSWESIARAAMTSRQAGVPLKTMLLLVSDEAAIGVFKAAYDYPRVESATEQQESVSNFIELILSECLKARSG